MKVVTISLALIAVSALHALARWLVARATGLSVPLVSVGIGPRLVERKLASGTTLRLAVVPIVIWLRVRGMAPDSASEPEEPTSYDGAGDWRRLANVVGGPAGSYLFGLVLMIVATFAWGIPVASSTVDVLRGSRAEQGGLRSGDTIVEIEGAAVSNFEDVKRAVAPRAGDVTRFVVTRDGARLSLDVVPEAGLSGGRTGVAGRAVPRPASLEESVVTGLSMANREIVERLSLFLPRRSEVAGPLVIVSEGSLPRSGWGWLSTVGRWSVGFSFSLMTFFPPFAGAALLRWLAELILRRRPGSVLRVGLYASGMAALLLAYELGR